MAAATQEILSSDLSGLVLALAEWGERDPSKLTWLDAPPAGKYRAAQAQLVALGALEAAGPLTLKGREMARLPMAPRLAALIVSAPGPAEKALAAEIAALAGERGIGGDSGDRGTGCSVSEMTAARAPAASRRRRPAGAPAQSRAAISRAFWPPPGRTRLRASGLAQTDPICWHQDVRQTFRQRTVWQNRNGWLLPISAALRASPGSRSPCRSPRPRRLRARRLSRRIAPPLIRSPAGSPRGG